MSVKHTVADPRQLQLANASSEGRGFFDFPAETRSAPPSRSGRPPTALVAGGASSLRPIPETVSLCNEPTSASGPVATRSGKEPWRSPAVTEFARGLETGKVEAMVLHGPRGLALRAAGEVKDHQVATKVVAEIEAKKQEQKAIEQGPSIDLAEHSTYRYNKSRRNAVPRAEDLVLAVPSAPLREAPAFGAVYEYRDACGTAKVVASTASMPERQFALDQRHYEHSLPAKTNPNLVWVGVSGGRRNGYGTP
ncbi:unnamed protein product [Symbiodinium natans]|uniref:Uncharacterized protein n=1 Tax=Symbiodinium natans TaxID=878477 RepID=A0A812PY43_9DINO|nr:unnamed protein product [Symbiodinium natans]